MTDDNKTAQFSERLREAEFSVFCPVGYSSFTVLPSVLVASSLMIKKAKAIVAFRTVIRTRWVTTCPQAGP